MLTRDKCEALLAELLTVYGLDEARRRLDEAVTDPAKAERRRKRAASGAPTTPADYQALHASELEAAGPVLDRLVSEMRALRGGRLLSPPEYRARWQAIVDAWNKTIERNDWRTLPPLCEVCGLPVLLRGADRRGKTVELSVTCSPKCQNTRKVRHFRS